MNDQLRQLQKVSLELDGSSIKINTSELARALRAFRCAQGLTQQQLADKWNCTRRQINFIENDKKLSFGITYRIYTLLMDELEKLQINGNE